MALEDNSSSTELTEDVIGKFASIYLITLAKEGSPGDSFVITLQGLKTDITSTVDAIITLKIPNLAFLTEAIPISEYGLSYFGLIVGSLIERWGLQVSQSKIVPVTSTGAKDVSIQITVTKDGDKTVLTACKQS